MARRKKDPWSAIWEGLGELNAMMEEAAPGSTAGMQEVLDHLGGDRRDSALANDAEYQRRRARDRAAFERGMRKESRDR